MDYCQLENTSLNPKGHQNCITGSKVIAILMDGADFAYRWSCIGKGLRLQPAQQAGFQDVTLIFRVQKGAKTGYRDNWFVYQAR